MTQKPTVTLIYHFFYPDDVVSARHFSDMAEELDKRGWNVNVLTSNRYCRYQHSKIDQRKEILHGIDIRRSYRPGWNQSKNIPRLCNALWLFLNWLFTIFRAKKTDCYIVGSDPQFSQILFPFLRILTGNSTLIYWCFDLYPEAILADARNSLLTLGARLVKPLIWACYRYVDVIIDLGPIMQKRIAAYNHNKISKTLTPWALKEPSVIPLQDINMREQLFGTDVTLGLLYSGNLGLAHEYELFLEIARKLRQLEPGIRFAFAGRGNRFESLKNALSNEDHNIKVAGFASESELEKRLAVADIHLVSLREQWDGVVVPSKFFGSLAVGRPVLYSGSKDSDIGQWVQEYECGMILDRNNVDEVVNTLVHLSKDKQLLEKWQKNAFQVYQDHFSKKKIMDSWDELLRAQKRSEGWIPACRTPKVCDFREPHARE